MKIRMTKKQHFRSKTHTRFEILIGKLHFLAFLVKNFSKILDFRYESANIKEFSAAEIRPKISNNFGFFEIPNFLSKLGLRKAYFRVKNVLISHFKTHLKPLFGQNSRSIQNKLNELSVIKIMFRYSFCIVTQFCILSLLFSVRIGSQLSFKSLEQRFYMEEDTKGRGREKFPLSFNVIAAQEI